MTLTEVIHAHRRDGETMTQCQARLRAEDTSAIVKPDVAPVIKDDLSDMSKKLLIEKVRANGGQANGTMSKDTILAILRG